VTRCCFVTDLHGHVDRYDTLFDAIARRKPDAVFVGGDLLPHALAHASDDRPTGGFLETVAAAGLQRLRDRLGPDYPAVFVILGNDDGRRPESTMRSIGERGLWTYAHEQRITWGTFTVYGYNFVPPTPFRLKDWERYDVSRHADPGCLSPEEGNHSYPVSRHQVRHATIQQDLERLTKKANLDRAIFLFHAPPYRTALDRAALDGKSIDHAPLDVHIGSIAVRRFIEQRQPWLTLHGHVHESTRLTGAWMDRIGRTVMLNAAHDGPELSVIEFDPADPSAAERSLW
jgi:Icc-related predicted phosphoesterase